MTPVPESVPGDPFAGQASPPGDLAEIYDLEHDPVTADLAFYRALTRRVRGAVLDLGCGSGHAAVALAPYVGRVIGVDQSAAMLRSARRRAAGVRNVEWRRGTLDALPLEDESVDAAMLLLSLTYVAEPRSAVGEAARGRP